MAVLVLTTKMGTFVGASGPTEELTAKVVALLGPFKGYRQWKYQVSVEICLFFLLH